MPSPVPSTPSNKRVTFEKQYHNGRGNKVYWPKMIKGDLSPNADFNWYYLCKVRDDIVPLLLGYIPILDGENEDSEGT